MVKPVEAVLIGAGNRGAEVYAPYALQHPERLKFVAVADPDPQRRGRFAAQHQIPAQRQYASWEDLLAQPQLGQAALICTQDWQHTAPTLAALQAGYHVLLEKPMATTAGECRQLVEASEIAGRQLHICHVLRYSAHFQKMREIVQSGQLGQIIDIAHRENVATWHMAHSYVRGNWRNAAESSPMILAKCCHDFDILLWLLDGPGEPRHCVRLASAGALTHFRAENAPPGAPMRCLDGCPAAENCLYYAPWVYQGLTPFWRSVAGTSGRLNRNIINSYLEHPAAFRAASQAIPLLKRVSEYQESPLTALNPNPTPEAIEQALREGPYGRCVYHCDNDVVDHQVVMMQFEGDTSVTLTMHGHSHLGSRTTIIEGTRGRMEAELGFGGSWIDVDEHRSDRHFHFNTSGADMDGHGGGDHTLLSAFLDSLQDGAEQARTTARQALASHLLAFAAEEARIKGCTMEANAFQ